jgi:hypothetical protein
MRYCAFSGSSWGVRAEYSHTADELGKLLAEDGISLVYGGASVDRSKNAFTHDKKDFVSAVGSSVHGAVRFVELGVS